MYAFYKLKNIVCLVCNFGKSRRQEASVSPYRKRRPTGFFFSFFFAQRPSIIILQAFTDYNEISLTM